MIDNEIIGIPIPDLPNPAKAQSPKPPKQNAKCNLARVRIRNLSSLDSCRVAAAISTPA